MQKREALLAEFKRWGYDERGWLPGTRDKYAREVRGADRWLREHRETTVVLAGPRDLRAYLFSKPPNARTRNRVRQVLVAFGAWKVEAHLDEINHALGLPRLPEPELLPKPLTTRQAEAVVAASGLFGSMVETMVLVLAYGGLRKSEVRHLEWSNVLLDDSEGWFHFAGKRRKERRVPILHPDVVKALMRWREACDDPRWVFPSPRREDVPVSETWVRDKLWEVGDEVGVHHLHPHQLRHTFATELSERGVALEVIQELMGHADPKTTRIYTKVRHPRLKEGMRTLDYRSTPERNVSHGIERADVAGQSPVEEELDGETRCVRDARGLREDRGRPAKPVPESAR